MPSVTEIRLERATQTLFVTFDDGATFHLPAEYLRVESPSAEVQGHSAEQYVLVPGKAAVRITTIEPVGHYAVRLIFDDGHDSGLFSWDWLHTLGREQERRWAAYEAALKKAGKSRTG